MTTQRHAVRSQPDYRLLLIGIREGERDRDGVRYCECSGCFAFTKGGKPRCSAHVDDMPYVQQLLATIADREAELAEIEAMGKRGWQAVRPAGTVLADVLAHLRANGPRTLERLARETSLPPVVVEACATWLRRQRLGRIGHTKRGSTTLRLAS